MLVYVLCEDGDMTMRSTPWPTGVAVVSEGDAKKWVAASPRCRTYYRTEVIEELNVVSVPVDRCVDCPFHHERNDDQWCSLSDDREFSYSDQYHATKGAVAVVLFPQWCRLKIGPARVGLRGDGS